MVDISDAFMSLGVAQKEIPHTLAPHITEDSYYAFIALLFGFRQRHYCGAGSGQCWPGSCNRWLPVTKASTKCTSTMLCGSYRRPCDLLSMLLTTTAALGLQGVDKEGGEVFTTHVGRSAADAHGRSPHDGAAGSLLHHGTGHTPEELGRTRHGTDTGASSSSRQGIVAVRKTAKGTMGGEHFLQSAPRSTGRHQDGCRRSTAIRPQRQQGQVCLVPRQTVGTSAALAHFLSGDGDGQTHQEVQAGQGQIPDSSHHHRCVPRGARCRLAHQQQGHQGLQLSGHPRRRQGAGLRAGQFKLPRHSGDPGSGGGPPSTGPKS